MLAALDVYACADIVFVVRAESTEMRFGGLISTSNIMVSDTVHVQSDLPLLWTTEFDDRP